MTEPTNRPDLPDVEEDHEPRTGKLVLSREVRGWMAGLAAVLVAFAAIAPSVEFGDLTGALVDKDAPLPGVGAGDSCTAEDQTGGMGGQSVRCTFNCPAEPGTLNVNADADDSSAQVSGTAACGGDSVHCSGKGGCSSGGTREGSGGGSCSGDSDEFVDSGLYVECSAGVTDGAGGIVEKPGSEICPVTEPVLVCIQPVCQHFAGGLTRAGIDLKDRCNMIWNKLAHVINDNSIALGFWSDGDSFTGLKCRGYVCVPLELDQDQRLS